MTQATKMTVTRALVELKKIGEKIEKMTMGDTFVAWKSGKTVSNGFSTEEDAKTAVVSNLSKLDAFIRNRQAIKAAIVKSNAATMVTVSNQLMSVAEAIEMKHTLTAKKNLLNTLNRQLTTCKAAVVRVGVENEAKVEKLLASMFAKEAKASDEQVKVVRDSVEATNSATLIDAGKVETKWIPQIEKEVEDIESELDFILSEMNATTMIEVSLQG